MFAIWWMYLFLGALPSKWKIMMSLWKSDWEFNAMSSSTDLCKHQSQEDAQFLFTTIKEVSFKISSMRQIDDRVVNFGPKKMIIYLKETRLLTKTVFKDAADAINQDSCNEEVLPFIKIIHKKSTGWSQPDLRSTPNENRGQDRFCQCAKRIFYNRHKDIKSYLYYIFKLWLSFDEL